MGRHYGGLVLGQLVLSDEILIVLVKVNRVVQNGISASLIAPTICQLSSVGRATQW